MNWFFLIHINKPAALLYFGFLGNFQHGFLPLLSEGFLGRRKQRNAQLSQIIPGRWKVASWGPGRRSISFQWDTASPWNPHSCRTAYWRLSETHCHRVWVEKTQCHLRGAVVLLLEAGFQEWGRGSAVVYATFSETPQKQKLEGLKIRNVSKQLLIKLFIETPF